MSRLYHVKAPSPQGGGVFIALPTGSGFLQCPNIHSLLQALPLLKGGYHVFIESGNCHVDDTRNSAVREFLRTDCTDLFFIDADVGFDPSAIQTLLDLDRDLVAGVYPKKHDTEDFPVKVFDGVALRAEADGCVEVAGAPTGFMRIRRNVIERMCEQNKHRRFRGQADTEDDPPYTILFERTFENGHRWSGDYSFCRKWRAMGGKVYVYPELPFTHEGLKEWSGVLGKHWRQKYGVTEARYKLALEELKRGVAKPEYFIWLWEWWDNPWSAQPSLLQATYHAALKADGPILECGSGITTIVLACASEVTKRPILSLEHESGWLTRVTVELRRAGLPECVNYAPIADYDGFQWYAKPDLYSSYSLVICDGPQRSYGRSGLFALMADEIKDAMVVMDDTDDKKQADLLKSWADKSGQHIQEFERFSICNRKPLLRAA